MSANDEEERSTAVPMEKLAMWSEEERGGDEEDVGDVNDEDDTDEADNGGEETVRKDTAYVNRMALGLQRGMTKAAGAVNEMFGGHFLRIVTIILYFAYFFYAMYYKFGDEPSIRLLWATVLGVLIATRHSIYKIVGRTRYVRWWKGGMSPSAAKVVKTLRFFTRWLLYGGVGAFMAYVLVGVATNYPSKLRSLPGIIIFPLLCFVFSSSPSNVNWHTVYWSVGLQFILAVLVMRWQGGKDTVLWFQDRLDEFFANSVPGSKLVFGETYHEHSVVFGAMPIVFLTNAALAMLYYLGAMQFLIRAIGTAMRVVMGTTAIESTGVAASIFMEGASAMLTLRPYLDKSTDSELFTLTTSCLASIGGSSLAFFVQVGIPVEFILPAMVISAPATFTICKFMSPETRKAKKITLGYDLPPEMQYSSILDAAQTGAISVISLVTNIVVSIFTFVSLMSFANNTFTWFGDRVGIEQLTIEKILSYVFYPFALLMGVELSDCRDVAMLMGYRVSTFSFLALFKMASLVGNRYQFEQYSKIPNATVTYVGDNIILDQANVTLIGGYISKRSEIIGTYALCGFSSVSSLSIILSIMVILVPSRRKWLAAVALRILVAGNMANFMVGCFAGLLVD